ncbi:hypothetical protein CEXT_453721 [Caerostris extrusa]|uniref:Uncharacterized protein n=1 Tax=Caerostris extrusa TaxID=172846 RepID=A0AAV4TJQ2_CAEEX|nr:hypothetical protein CEXT_453721 [Caerostris extrusa]
MSLEPKMRVINFSNHVRSTSFNKPQKRIRQARHRPTPSLFRLGSFAWCLGVREDICLETRGWRKKKKKKKNSKPPEGFGKRKIKKKTARAKMPRTRVAMVDAHFPEINDPQHTLGSGEGHNFLLEWTSSIFIHLA